MRTPTHIRAAIKHRQAEARRAVHGDDLALAWHLLGEAHILSQPWAGAHTAVHWHMLVLAARLKMLPEVRGQLVRLAVAGIGSAVGTVPVGNHGRATIPAREPAPLSPELAQLLDGHLHRRAIRPTPLIADT